MTSRTPAKQRGRQTVGLFVNVAPEAKAILDRYATTANVNLWEIVEALVFTAARAEDQHGLPIGLGFTAAELQPALDVATQPRGGVRAA